MTRGSDLPKMRAGTARKKRREGAHAAGVRGGSRGSGLLDNNRKPSDRVGLPPVARIGPDGLSRIIKETTNV